MHMLTRAQILQRCRELLATGTFRLLWLSFYTRLSTARWFASAVTTSFQSDAEYVCHARCCLCNECTNSLQMLHLDSPQT